MSYRMFHTCLIVNCIMRFNNIAYRMLNVTSLVLSLASLPLHSKRCVLTVYSFASFLFLILFCLLFRHLKSIETKFEVLKSHRVNAFKKKFG